MELCKSDVARLERRGYERDDFSKVGTDGILRLRNSGGYCFFYDHDRKRCKEYASRPRGCGIYPVILSVDDGIIVDRLCPEAGTLTKDEIKSKGRRLQRLLDKIDLEARNRFDEDDS
jgi:Fe-S-cluster containining protein